jgi:hypothetical protein
MSHDKQGERHKAFLARQRAKGLYQPEKRKLAKRIKRSASRAEQQARYLDCGPQAWDDVGGSES